MTCRYAKGVDGIKSDAVYDASGAMGGTAAAPIRR
jgi:hypothetical protein